MKKYFILFSLLIATTSVMAEVQSPIYTDDIGRSHFLGKGGYSTVRQTRMEAAGADAVNDMMFNVSKQEQKIEETAQEINNDIKEAQQDIETDITKVIQERPQEQKASFKSTYSSEQRKMDASAPYGYGMTNIPAGVNDSKTMYRDDIGRIHFFGKGNLIKE
ncbi:hypothetical protein IJD34_06155 [bacterium]|nr:hypothetical protein [bacterium]